jgi:hypothetical protein
MLLYLVASSVIRGRSYCPNVVRLQSAISFHVRGNPSYCVLSTISFARSRCWELISTKWLGARGCESTVHICSLTILVRVLGLVCLCF